MVRRTALLADHNRPLRRYRFLERWLKLRAKDSQNNQIRRTRLDQLRMSDSGPRSLVRVRRGVPDFQSEIARLSHPCAVQKSNGKNTCPEFHRSAFNISNA